MTLVRARSRTWRLPLVGTVVAAAVLLFPSASAATPTYEGGASAGWAYQEGDVLNANPGTWSSTTAVTYTYKWFDENNVALGTGSTYKVVSSDVGHQIYAAITATDGTPPSLTVNTPTVGPIHFRPPVNVERPTVTGALLQGATLAANAGKWAPGGASTAPIQITYAWYRGCTTGPRPECGNSGYIGGASSLVLSSADVGRAISLTVTGSYPDGAGGEASNSVWLGNLGPVVGSSIRAGDTLRGTVPWTVTAPGAQSIVFQVNGVQAAVQAPDAAGAASFDLDTTKLRNGGTDLSVTARWGDGATVTTVPIGSVTVSNAAVGPPPPVVVEPRIAKPTTIPRRPLAGKRFVLTFAVTRSDTHRALTRGRMIGRATVNGRVVAHHQSFATGKARLVLRLPRTARHKMLTVKLTISRGDRSATRVVAFVVR